MRSSDQFWLFFWVIVSMFVLGLILTINYIVTQSDVREQDQMKACVASGKTWVGRDFSEPNHYNDVHMECK